MEIANFRNLYHEWRVCWWECENFTPVTFHRSQPFDTITAANEEAWKLMKDQNNAGVIVEHSRVNLTFTTPFDPDAQLFAGEFSSPDYQNGGL